MATLKDFIVVEVVVGATFTGMTTLGSDTFVGNVVHKRGSIFDSKAAEFAAALKELVSSAKTSGPAK